MKSLFWPGVFVVSVVTASQLENFVSVIGAVACIPLAFTFPAFFHACAEVRKEQADAATLKPAVMEEGRGDSFLSTSSEVSLLAAIQADSYQTDKGLPRDQWCFGPISNQVIVLYGMIASGIALVGAVSNWIGHPVHFPIINL